MLVLRYAFLFSLGLILCVPTLCPVRAQSGDDEDAEQTRAEIALGRDAGKVFDRHEHIIDKGPEVDHLRRILKKLVPFSGRPGLPYSVHLVGASEVNAITFPGGRIYVFRGLMSQKMDDSMLAAVLAHEVAHAACSHGYRKMLQMKALGGLTGGQAGMVSGLTKVLLLSGVGRTYEYQADRQGLHIEARAGYDPHGMVKVLQLLQRLGKGQPGLLTGMMATHPPTAERIKRVQAELKAM
jgi:beta-barrel assembly-enhancing protease